MGFQPANIWQDFKQGSEVARGTVDDNSNQVLLGPRLNEAVRHFANGYLEKLELGPATKATDERAKLLDLHWGQIEHDGALLRGLGAALTGFAGVLGTNVTTLGETWKGESYDAFKAGMDKIQRTVEAYGSYATATGDGLIEAMSQLRVVFEEFAQKSAGEFLNFGDVSPPEYWHKIGTDNYTPDALADGCPTWFLVGNCTKNDEEQSNVINGRFVTQRRWDICMADPCEDNAGRVLIMYHHMVDTCHQAREGIRGKLKEFFSAVGATVDTVSAMYEAVLGNVYTLAHEEVFSSLRVIGASGGQPVEGGGDTGAPTGYPGDTTYPGSSGGGYPGGGGPGPVAVAEPVQPTPEPSVEDTTPAEAPPDTAVQEPAAAADQPASVEIKDGDRTIGVTSPDGEGHVRVTVDDGTGKTKTYELDFDAASGLAPQPPANGEAKAEGAASDEEAPQQVAARTDGKCVIQDGPLTITAERPLFSPDSIQLTVDDGTGNPTSYTLDFDEEQDTAETPPSGAANAETAKPDTSAAPAAGGAPRSGSDQVADAPADAAPAEEVPEEAPADEAAEAVAGPAPAAPDTPAEAPPADGEPAPTTTQQAPAPTTPSASDARSQPGWLGDRESMSGVLVPDQPEGEAGLGVASDDTQPEPDASGMVGSGMPMMGGGAPPSSGGEPGRAGSGWSVHGDLFDSGEPVYSMHGVLGDDDQNTE